MILIILGVLSQSLFRSTTNKYLPKTYNENSNFLSLLDTSECPKNLLYSCTKTCDAKTRSGCQFRHIAVAPSSLGDESSFLAAKNFVLWGNNLTMSYKTDTMNYKNDTFHIFSSEQSFLDTILYSQYSRDSNPVFSAAIIFKSGYPQWDYIVRLNQSYNNYKG